MKEAGYQTVIFNAPDPDIFYSRNKKLIENRKIKLIATSWSSNMRKGFDIYKFLDRNPDFNRYEITFVGNSQVRFENIHYIEPLQSTQLADELRKHDIFITASLNDPCSNSLIEALHCGLPAIVRNSGGHHELIGNGGVTFEGESDVISAIEKVASNLGYYQEKIDVPDMSHVAEQYYNFCKQVHVNKEETKLTYLDYINLIMMCYKWKLRKTFGTKKVK
jgi:glycosyltransferase involved in cell wall biosynthesis